MVKSLIIKENSETSTKTTLQSKVIKYFWYFMHEVVILEDPPKKG